MDIKNSMNKEELIEFLRENLSISVSTEYETSGTYVTVELILNGETISSDHFTKE